MSQVEHGIRRVLAQPAVYNAMQWLMGANTHRKDFVGNYVEPKAQDNILDIGCGTGEILDFLPADISYYGFDMSEAYIAHAQAKYPDRGEFRCAFVDSLVVENLPAMNIVLASGLIHHLDDAQVLSLLGTAKKSLVPGGRFIAIDPVYSDDQSRIAKWLIDRDRGENVRTKVAYLKLAESEFTQVESYIVHRNWVPYTHHILICK